MKSNLGMRVKSRSTLSLKNLHRATAIPTQVNSTHWSWIKIQMPAVPCLGARWEFTIQAQARTQEKTEALTVRPYPVVLRGNTPIQHFRLLQTRVSGRGWWTFNRFYRPQATRIMEVREPIIQADGEIKATDFQHAIADQPELPRAAVGVASEARVLVASASPPQTRPIPLPSSPIPGPLNFGDIAPLIVGPRGGAVPPPSLSTSVSGSARAFSNSRLPPPALENSVSQAPGRVMRPNIAEVLPLPSPELPSNAHSMNLHSPIQLPRRSPSDLHSKLGDPTERIQSHVEHSARAAAVAVGVEISKATLFDTGLPTTTQPATLIKTAGATEEPSEESSWLDNWVLWVGLATASITGLPELARRIYMRRRNRRRPSNDELGVNNSEPRL